MPSIVVDLPAFVTAGTSGSTSSNGVGLLDEAASITIFMTSSAATSSTGAFLQVSQFDPSVTAPTGVTQSTGWFTYSPTSTGGSLLLSTGQAFTITNISFRGIRISSLTSATVSEVIARISKQISV